MSNTLYTLIAAAGICLPLSAKDTAKPSVAPEYAKEVFKGSDGSTLNVRLKSPKTKEKGKLYPLVVMLHGAGGRGSDNLRQLTDAGMLRNLQKTKGFEDAYVLAGQVPKGQRWVDIHWGTLDHRMPAVTPSMKLLIERIDQILADKTQQIDPKRVYAMGLSMGGYGTWDLIQRRPELFAAAIPICGGGDKEMAKAIAPIPIWAWHGDKDRVIKPSRSKDMVEAIKKAGGNAKYTEVKGQGHGVWNDCYKSAELWQWMFEQKKP